MKNRKIRDNIKKAERMENKESSTGTIREEIRTEKLQSKASYGTTWMHRKNKR